MYMQDRGKGDNPKMYVTILLMYHFIEEYHCMANVNIYNDKIIFSSMGCSIYTYIIVSSPMHNESTVITHSINFTIFTHLVKMFRHVLE